MTTRDQRLASLAAAVKRAGGLVRFAGATGVSLQAIAGWKRRGYLPFERATYVEQLYAVPRVTLVRPDVAAAYLTPPHPGLGLI